MFHSDKKTSKSMVLFFLICIIVAGVYGSITAKPSILYIQALPAALALLAVWFSEE
jgi:putative membrane protein